MEERVLASELWPIFDVWCTLDHARSRYVISDFYMDEGVTQIVPELLLANGFERTGNRARCIFRPGMKKSPSL